MGAQNPRVILHGNPIQTQKENGSISSRNLTLFVFYMYIVLKMGKKLLNIKFWSKINGDIDG